MITGTKLGAYEVSNRRWHSLWTCLLGRVALNQRTAGLNAPRLEVSNEASRDWAIVRSSELPTCGLRSI